MKERGRNYTALSIPIYLGMKRNTQHLFAQNAGNLITKYTILFISILLITKENRMKKPIKRQLKEDAIKRIDAGLFPVIWLHKDDVLCIDPSGEDIIPDDKAMSWFAHKVGKILSISSDFNGAIKTVLNYARTEF